MKKEVQQQKLSLKDRIYVILTLLVIVSFIFIGVYFLRLKNRGEDDFVNSDFTLTKAKVIDKSTYKSWTLTVQYRYKDKIYECTDGVKNNSLKVGDSLWVKVSNKNPELIIVELP